jgi:beta-galactosidase
LIAKEDGDLMDTLWSRLSGLAYGGDYNPEQWPAEVWERDVALMREAGVNLVSVGIFSWASLEPQPGEYEFGWLDQVIALLHEAGIAVDLGTPTAAPPPWFLHRSPEARPVTREGIALGGGSRQVYCPSSLAYAAAASNITRRLAERYGAHPAVVLWHVGNEFGAPMGECYCETSAAAFRSWLRARYRDVSALNEAWGSTFWSQRYSCWDEIEAPRVSTSVVNPAQRLDFARFSNDALLECYKRERDILRDLSPGVPVTTNFQANNCKGMNYWAWAPEVDVISNDNYLIAERPDSYLDLAMSADLSRSFGAGKPWLLMEHSTSAVSWQPRNVAKSPGEMRRNSLAHLARGADGLLFFQWRGSRFGAEKFHSAMLPFGGTDTRGWREVTELGAELTSLDDMKGSTVEPDIAILWDWECWWALELEWRPSVDLGYLERMRAWYAAAFRAGLTADFVHPEADLSRYPFVIAPSLYLTTPAAAENLTRYVTRGGTLLVSYFSGIVDGTDTIYPGALPGGLRDLLGINVEEWLPLRPGERVALTWDEASAPGAMSWADTWAEHVRLAGAKPVVRYAPAPATAAAAAGGPAVTRHEVGAGRAWYVSARTDAATTDRILVAACESAGVAARDDRPELEIVRRVKGTRRFTVAINHGERDAETMVSGQPVVVPAGGAMVIREGDHTSLGTKENLMRRALLALGACALAVGLAVAPGGAARASATVVNPGFSENGATTTPTGWTTSSADDTASASYSEATAEGYDGDAYQLTHWSSSAFEVDTYQTLTGLSSGDYTLGVWTRSNGGDTSNYISLTGCGGSGTPTNVPVDSDGDWVHIVTYVDVTTGDCTINFVTDGNADDWTNYDGVTFTSGSAPLAIRGADLSSLDRSQLDGGVYYTASGTEENAEEQLASAGMNYVRLRVWVNPGDGFDDEAEMLAGAAQAASHGEKILLDIQYSDTWTDPGAQTLPAAWADDTFSELESQVYTYSYDLVEAMVEQGTPPAMVQVGNEINVGMLWPYGELDCSSGCGGWPDLAALLNEGIAGIHAAYSSAEIVLHLATSDDEAYLASWYSTAESYGVDFNVIGLSYYDYWDGRLDVLQTDLNDLAAEFDKPVMVAETAYPWTLTTDDASTALSFDTSADLDPGYAATPAGQQANFEDVLSVVQAVPNGLGLGAFYWEPTWTVVAGNGWNPADSSSGDGWENQAMWNYSDTGLPAIADFAAR